MQRRARNSEPSFNSNEETNIAREPEKATVAVYFPSLYKKLSFLSLTFFYDSITYALDAIYNFYIAKYDP